MISFAIISLTWLVISSTSRGITAVPSATLPVLKASASSRVITSFFWISSVIWLPPIVMSRVNAVMPSIIIVIDVTAAGDVETQELRLALQPAWRATDWLELRGSLGLAATRVSVDVDATLFVDGAAWRTVSGDDDDWVFTGLCGLDALVSPRDWLSLFVGADIRLGGNTFDYEAGLARGTVELARATYRAGVAVRF